MNKDKEEAAKDFLSDLTSKAVFVFGEDSVCVNVVSTGDEGAFITVRGRSTPENIGQTVGALERILSEFKAVRKFMSERGGAGRYTYTVGPDDVN